MSPSGGDTMVVLEFSRGKRRFTQVLDNERDLVGAYLPIGHDKVLYGLKGWRRERGWPSRKDLREAVASLTKERFICRCETAETEKLRGLIGSKRDDLTDRDLDEIGRIIKEEMGLL